MERATFDPKKCKCSQVMVSKERSEHYPYNVLALLT